ncbi:MAG TPA: AMP-binding protein, partial [Ignavibacteriaceae bacterium]|nr:AMP-binding protein [Ignavibacteriaceae bacterium]
MKERSVKHPESPALIFEGAVWSYTKLNSTSNRFASLLIKEGIGPGVLVGLCIKWSFEQIVAIIDVMKTGAAYIPIDPTYPTERIRYIISDSGMTLLVTGSGVEIPIAATNLSFINYPQTVHLLEKEPDFNI